MKAVAAINPRQSDITNAGRAGSNAFSLIEVMFAIGVFFIAVFAILELVSQNMRTARALQTMNLDTSTLPSLLSMTNSLEVGPIPLEMKLMFEETHPGYAVNGFVNEYTTNGLFQVDYTVTWEHEGRAMETRNSILLWRPASIGLNLRGGRRR